MAKTYYDNNADLTLIQQKSGHHRLTARRGMRMLST